MASSKSRSTAPLHPSLSHACHFYSNSSTSSPNFSLHTSSSPNCYGYSSSVNFDVARSVSPKRNPVPPALVRKMCLCSPSSHPGAFRCSLHRNCSSAASSSSVTQAEISDEEFRCENRQRGRRRMGEEGAHCHHPPLFSPIAKENVFLPAAQQAPPCDQSGRRGFLLKPSFITCATNLPLRLDEYAARRVGHT